jgi:hypothetical protein
MRETRVTGYRPCSKRVFFSAAIVCILILGSVAPFANAQCPQGIVDGGFEAGFPWTDWDIQSSDLFGTPICDTGPSAVIDCLTNGGVTAPRTGDNWVWFGGNGGVEENATLGQTVTVNPPGAIATLRFWMRVSEVDDPPLDDTIDIMVDGNPVQTFTEPATAEGAYTLRTVPLQFLPAGNHTIVFDYASPDDPVGGNTNFLIDDISLDLCLPTATTADISGRVLTSAGRGLVNATVTITSQFGVVHSTTTGTGGRYTLEDVLVGNGYVMQVTMRGYSFSPQLVNVDSDLTGVNFVAGR